MTVRLKIEGHELVLDTACTITVTDNEVSIVRQQSKEAHRAPQRPQPAPKPWPVNATPQPAVPTPAPSREGVTHQIEKILKINGPCYARFITGQVKVGSMRPSVRKTFMAHLLREMIEEGRLHTTMLEGSHAKIYALPNQEITAQPFRSPSSLWTSQHRRQQRAEQHDNDEEQERATG